MNSDAVEEIFCLIEQMQKTIERQNKLITKLTEENLEKENFIHSLLNEQNINED